MTTKYDPGLEAHIPDLEVVRLRGEVAALKARVAEMEAVLVENGLEEAKPKPISTEERIAREQLEKIGELSAKGVPMMLEDVKIYEVLVKCLLAIQGKAMPEPKKGKKKEVKVEVAELLRIVTEDKN